MISTIFIVTPSLNSVATIDRTIQSVVSQAGNFRIRYHVKDGGSTDGTLDRLQWWSRWLRNPESPRFCRSIHFTFSSEDDIGMYDALIQGFSHVHVNGPDFMTWINADDILLPGAFAFVSDVDNQFTKEQISWVGGAVCVFNNNRAVAGYDRYLPSAAIRAGACDGIHWDFVQQEGTFFRNWLWQAIEPEKSIRDFRMAGDWNIWRLFAQRASLVQWSQPLAAFNIREGQLSAVGRAKYHEEIDACVPREERENFLTAAAGNGPISRRRLTTRYPDGQFTLVEESKFWPVKNQFEKRFKTPATATIGDKPDRVVYMGDITTAQEIVELPPLTVEAGLTACDSDWQYPAITEQHAFKKIRELANVPDNAVYVAYPWATLIDKIQTQAKDIRRHLEIFREFCRQLPQDRVKITVSQHIFSRRFLHLFEQAGIDHIFWTHATKEDAAAAAASPPSSPSLHPFPLYPVQQLDAPPAGAAQDRPILYSFIGARADHHYPTQTRNWIIDHLAADPRAQVIGRNSWHFSKIVYEHQIAGNSEPDASNGTASDTSAEEEFKTSLTRSVFSLCPAGTGPNSIRLWESLGAGSVPVIIADTWAPPGNLKLWEAAAVFCEETLEAVQALPLKLAAIAADPEQLEAKRQAMRQLWLLYGPETFVYDILQLMLRLRSQNRHQQANLVSTASEAMEEPNPQTSDPATALRRFAADLLLDTRLIETMRDELHPLGQRVAAAASALAANDPTLLHYRRVADWAAKSARLKSPPRPGSVGAPQLLRRHGPKICLVGRHSHRTPLSYGPIRDELTSPIRFVDSAVDADLVLTGFNINLVENAAGIADWLTRAPHLKFAVISEEPLWDLTWSGGYTERDRSLDLPGGGRVAYRALNHETSSIFDFGTLPYFPLTTDEFPTTYATRLAEYMKLKPDELLARWRSAPITAAFFAEKRAGAEFRHADAGRDIANLSEYRTLVADKTRELSKNILCVGKGWREQTRRQDLADWHLDKLATLAGRTRICSAIENVHHRSYVSEKMFDAFAVGAVPVYHASTKHRVFDLVPAAAMINTHGLAPEDAAARITAFEPDRTYAEAWLDTCARLRILFADTAAIVGERRRVATECLREIEALL